MENSTHTIGKDGTPMVVTTGGGHGYNNDYFANWAGINATNSGTTAVLNAVTNAENVINKGVYDAAVAGIKQTGDSAVATTKAVTDSGMSNADTTNRNGTAVTKAVTDGSLSASRDATEIRGAISTIGTANAIAAKDIEIAIYRDGCHTRDKSAEQHNAIQIQQCKDHADLAAKIAECCAERAKEHCEILSAIATSDTKRLESEIANLRQERLLDKINDKPGNN